MMKCATYLLLLIALLFAITTAQNRRYPEKKLQHQQPPKVKLNVEGLPSLQEILEELGLAQYFLNFVKMGVTETRLFLRLSPMDFRIMEIEWNDFTTEYSAKLKDKLAVLVTQATVKEEPARPELDDRNRLLYGRVYLANSVQSFEFARASFGGPPPIGTVQVVQENTMLGCDARSHTEDYYTNKILMVRRGNCTFLEKALNAHKWNASGLIIVNNEDRLDHPSSGLGVEKNISEAMVLSLGQFPVLSFANTSWAKFEHAIKFNHEHTTFINIIPLKCAPGGSCKPVTAAEEKLQPEVSGGTIRVKSSNGEIKSYDFLTSNFGCQLPVTIPSTLQLATPIDLCQQPTGTQTIVPDHTILVTHRGNCRFDIKALHAQAIGARAVVVVDVDDHPLQRIGGMSPEVGYVGIPSLLITAPAGDFIQQHINAGETVHAELIPWLDSKYTDMWIELSFTEWAETDNDKVAQLEGLAQKYIQSQSHEIEAWIRRRIDEIVNPSKKSIATDADQEL